MTMSTDPTTENVSPALQSTDDEATLQPSIAGNEENPGAQIGRVIDVPLAVTLRFGQRHLTFRDVLALATGSLVELDRQVEEPVDLVLGDRLIARGEVVVVDGNYGLRVTEVIEGAAKRIQRMHATHTEATPPETQSE